jgi:hypothetical protein
MKMTDDNNNNINTMPSNINVVKETRLNTSSELCNVVGEDIVRERIRNNNNNPHELSPHPTTFVISPRINIKPPFIVELLKYTLDNKQRLQQILKNNDVIDNSFSESSSYYEEATVGIELDIEELINVFNQTLISLMDIVENSLDYCRNMCSIQPYYADLYTNKWCLLLEKIKWLIRHNRIRMSHMHEYASIIPRFYLIIENICDKTKQFNALTELLQSTIEKAITETERIK